MINHALVLFTVASFAYYSVCALTTKRMAVEFERYGFADKRIFVALSQIFGTLGLIMGFIAPFIGFLAAAGFATQMACAMWVRYKIRDPLLHSLPAAGFFAICIVIAVGFASEAINRQQ